LGVVVVTLEWALLEKIVDFLGALPPSDKWQLAGFAFAALASIAVPLWTIIRRTHQNGREIGRTEGRDEGLQQGSVENLTLRAKLGDANEEIDVLREKLELANKEIDVPADLLDLLRIRDEVVKESAQIWSLRDARPLAHLRERLLAGSLKIVTIGNLKGGVGKTTLAANLAAFFERNLQKKVLVIDLDYQGSISAMMLRAAEKTIEFSLTEHLLDGTATGRSLLELAKNLAPVLPNTRIIPASYTLQDAEDRLMARWLLHTTDKDVRFNLADMLLSPELQQNFDIALLDMGPRLTTASISALCASTHIIVPTNLDQLAVETVGSLLSQVKRIRSDLGLAVDLAGVVGTMTHAMRLTDAEVDALGSIREQIEKTWGDGHIFVRTVPHTPALGNVAGTGIGYLRPGRAGHVVRTVFDSLGQEVATRIGLQ
jgi:chromosome partitioning protein